jgi:penicillin amidase
MSLPKLLFRLLLGRRLPVVEGTLAVDGLSRPVTIRRDGWGVPHIEAAGDADAWFALGFCTAQDRSFQLESTLRVVRGTLAEIVGRDALPIDRISRRIGFIPAAERQWAVTGADVQMMLDAYARGINAGNAVGRRNPAHEFLLLRTPPSAWTPIDVLGYIKLISFLLATNWDVELARLKILTEDGPEAVAALDPTYPDWQPVISPPGAAAGPAIDRLAEHISALAGVIGAGGGSNNWALAGSRTASGRPLLANDPHLASTLPPHWYLAHITTPSWSLAGASFVGLPSISVGHNGFAAWGVTVGMTDNTDLFVEEIGSDGRAVRQDDGWAPCVVRTETIRVKGEADVIEEVLITARGPIVGPALAGEVGAISLRATWLDPHPLEGVLELHRVRSFEEFRRYLGRWPALPLNMAYADESGTIGWQLMGLAPRRRKGAGAIPLSGADPDAGWEDEPVPAEEMPYLENPPEGFVATANNKVIPDGAGPFLTVDYLEGYRAARIVETLEERSDWDIPGCWALQLDLVSVPWREMREAVLAAPATNPATAQALDLLRPWDGILAADSPAAAIFELFLAEMAARVTRTRAPRSYRWALGESFSPLATQNAFGARRSGHLSHVLRAQPPGWFPHSWPGEIAAALAAVVRRLQQDHGSNPAGWAWGTIRPLRLVHPFGLRKPLDRIFNLGPIPCGGDCDTPSQAAVRPLDPTANPPFIASLRMVADTGAWENSRWVLPGGQSGNPLSPHYDDQLPLWQRGEGIPIPWSEDAVRVATRATLHLKPAATAAAPFPEM